MDSNVTSLHSLGAGSYSTSPAKIIRLLLTALLIVGAPGVQVVDAQTPVTTGYRDFSFGGTVVDAPTGEKPESKLWFNDGFWWANLWSTDANSYTIHKFNAGTQGWTSTGIAIDDRSQTKADALWSGDKLYVVSHIFALNGAPTTSAESARLYRYSYDPDTDAYTLDAGFPVNANSSTSETLVLDRDSTGQLWVTWTEGGKVKINRSTADDLTWGTPFDLPVQGGDLNLDDISSLVAFDGNKIGVMWTSRADQKTFFAVHLDADADNVWQAREDAVADPALGSVSDDHLNLKASSDGEIYAAVKTRLSTNEAPHVFLAKRTTGGIWSRHLVGRFEHGHTRPITVLDEENGRVYVFAMADFSGDSEIYMKSASLGNLVFPEGAGTPFIRSTTDTHINNPSSTKQSATSESGLLVIASDPNSNFYFHNLLDLNAGGDPDVASFSPMSGVAGTEVTITGSNFENVISVNFGNVSAGPFTVDSDAQIRVTVPVDATSGAITVTTVGGEASSAVNFSVLPAVISFTPTTGFVATEVTVTGSNLSDATDIQFNGVSAGTFVIDSHSQVRVQVPFGASTGKISITTPGGTAQSATDFAIVASTTTIFNPIHDTWVRISEPDVPGNGSSATLRARVAADILKSYLKFEVSGLSGSILSATLRLNVVGGSADGGSFYLVSNNRQGTSTPWTESELTWNDGPEMSGTALGSAGNVAIGQWVEIDVTSAITGNGTFSFGLKNESSDDVQYHSKETATPTSKPELVIQTSGGGAAVPAIASFTPLSGPIGTSVTVSGTDFTGATSVRFNNITATFVENSSTEITATVPDGAATGKITVTTAGGTGVSTDDFTVTVPVPTITSFAPTSGIVGSLVTITGTNFTDVSEVKFNSTSATSFTVTSPTEVTASVPTGATTGKISVITGGGTALSATDFTVTIPPAPTIISFSPISGVVGTQVTITGTDFIGASEVKFNTTSATVFTVNSATEIVADVPVGAATGQIAVTTSGGTALSGPNFTVTLPPAPPTVASFTPTSGPVNTEVTITGTNFTGISTVQFNSLAASFFTVDSETQLRATVPLGATTGVISVTNGAGSGQSLTDFTVTVASAPTITSIAPTSGAVGTEVTITGTNFSGVTDVKINTTSVAFFSVISTTQITATVPAGATSGKVSVTTLDGTALSANDFVVAGGGSSSLTFLVQDDSWARKSTPTTTNGSDDRLRARKTSSDSLRAFLKFNVSGLSGVVLSAKVRLEVINDSNDGGAIYAVSNDFNGTSTPWTETALNWNNSPLITGAPLSTKGAVLVNEIVEFDVTPAITGNGIYSFGIRNSSTNDVHYYSKEGLTVPQLVIVRQSSPIPAVSSFAPSSAQVGGEVTITGTDFINISSVLFNGTPASAFTVNSATQVTATVPAGATTGTISVGNDGGSGNSVNNFTVLPPTPIVTSFSPSSAAIGSQVTITGSNFINVTGVFFNGTAASTFTVNSATQITATVPAGTSNGKISVVNDGGTGLSATDFIIAGPSITSFTPTSGVVSASVTITGNNFTGATSVQFNGTAATSFTVDSNTQITAAVPFGATTGKLSVTTIGGTAFSVADFTVNGHSITSFAPASGLVGTVVTITGTNFISVSGVQFNGSAASAFTVNSATEILATVPANATTGKIGVIVPGGTALSVDDFIVSSPTITSFTPTSGLVGTEVTITGANFTGASAVKFNGISASSFIVDSATQIRAIVPAGSTTGKISVTTVAGTALSVDDFGVNPPVITSFSPTSAVVGAEVTIIGSNITGTTNVTFNGTTGFFTVDSQTQLRAIVPAAATTGKIGVTNGAGTGYSANDFFVTPVVTAFSPVTGSVGTEVTITGSGLNGTSSVQFNGTAAASFTLDSPTQVRATVPSGASTGKIGVTTAGGTALSLTDFALAPEVLSFAPASGLVGAAVTITGINFTGVSTVSFNGTVAPTFTVDSNTQIRANVPGGATTGKISVTSTIGAGLSASDFVVTPAIVSFTPASGVPGSEVTITGSGFTGASSVQFNGVAASTFTVDLHSQIRVTVPLGASTGKISVTTAGGTAISASDFTLPGPSIASFNPAGGVTGAEITITGTNFSGATSVKFNGFSASAFTVDSNTQIRATVPSDATNGKITVVTPGGTTLSANDFLVIPAIAAFTPLSGVAGTEVTITGSSFSGTTAVQFNGVASPMVTVDSNTQVRATVPAGATTGKISLTTPGGTAQSTADFVISSPAITSFTPSSGVAGTEVTITGSNLVDVNNVSFNGIAASTVTADSPTQVRAIVPAGMTTGKISVTTAGGTALSAADFTVAPPTITSFSPVGGMEGSQVTITGSNFIGTTSVQFNGVAATAFAVDFNTQLRVTIPLGATTGKLSVITVGGTALSVDDFTVGPAITSFTPNNGVAGTEVTITGLNFTGTTGVKFNNTVAAFLVDTATQIRAFVPAGATNGKISVTTAVGTTLSAADFIVQGPVISSFSPASAVVATEVTIVGNSLTGASSVKFNGTEASAYFIDSATQIRAVVPNGALTGKISITTGGGTALSPTDFLVLPVITSFTPGSGLAGIEVTISGNSFTGATSVQFNGTAAVAFTVDSYTQVRATVPASATTGKLSVTTPGGTALSATDFTIPAPVVTSFAPVSAMVGTEVTITGSNLIGTTEVKFNGVSASSFTVDSATQIRVTVPSNATTGKISVTTPGGTALSAADFTVGPVIVSFSPTGAVVGTEVTITGSNFLGTTGVNFNGTGALFIVDTSTQIRATVPAAAATGKISVTTPVGTALSATDFLITPVVSSFTPASGPVSTQVTITGSGLTAATAVQFNGLAASAFTVNSSTQILATVAAGSTTGKISVTTAGGTAESSTNFTVFGAVITSFTPSSGLAGVEVTIAGSNFVAVSSVSFNGSPATTFTVDSPVQIRATVPAGATTGKISVVTGGGTAISATDFAMIPVISSFAPASGPAGLEVTISGNSFTGASNVQFNGINAASFFVDSNTQIRATVPVGAATGKISVTTAGGTALSVNNFTVSSPAITSFTPLIGLVGSEVTITGSALSGANSVTFNGTAAVVFSIDSNTQIRATVPAGATTGKISVTTGGGTAVSVDDFTVTSGATLTANFVPQYDAYVRQSTPTSSFGSVTTLRVRNSSSDKLNSYLKFQVADITGPVTGAKLYLMVINASSNGGSVYLVSNNYQGTSTPWTQSGVNWNNAPTIGGTPISTVGAVTIGQLVEFDVTSAISGNGDISFGISNDVSDDAHYSSQEGSTKPLLVIEYGTGALPVPTIASFTPASGIAGTEVTVTGSNFTGASSVKFNGVTASTFTVDSGVQLRATVPAGATTGKVSVTTSGGTATSVADFTVTTPPTPPTITSFIPTSGVIGAEVTVTGTNLSGATAVHFNGIAASTFTVDSATQLRVNVPIGASTGKISVTTPGGTVLSAADFAVTVPPTPSITSFTPASGLVGIEVTITGTNLTGATAVQFNGMASSNFSVDLATQIRATVPAGATTGKISVTTAGGTAVSANDFTVTTGGATATLNFTPAQDSYVRLSTPTSNYGSTTTLRSRDNGSDNLDFYLKFDVSGVLGAVVSAKLRLGVLNASSDGGSIYPVSNDYKATTTPWTQSGINWNNAPVISGSPLNSAGAVAIGQIVEFDVTAAVTGNGIFSFGVSNGSSDDVHYSSKEGATRPELIIEYSTGVPASPAISGFTPTSGLVGTQVTITGSNFTGATSVTFNGTIAPAFSVNSNTQILATVPSGATTGKISVTTSGGTAMSATDFSVTTPPAPPTIVSFTPTSGGAGTEITIVGTNFTGATSVQFNTTEAGTFTVDTATQIRANVPSGASTGKISVTTPGGTAQSTADFSVTGGGTATVTIQPFHDAYVRLSTPTTNYGDASTLRVRKTSSEQFNSFMKFHVTGFSGVSIVSVKIRLKVTNASVDGGTLYKASAYYLGTTTEWLEDGVTWSNAPALVGSALGSAGALAIGSVIEFDVTSAVPGNGTYSFALTNNASDDVYYSSTEGANDPEMVIEYLAPAVAVRGGLQEAQIEALPREFSLSQNYPNPFNGQTTIEYALPEAVQVRLAIYNSLGQLVRRLVDESQAAGYKKAIWDGRDDHGQNVGSGIYFYRLDAGSHRLNGRMILQQ